MFFKPVVPFVLLASIVVLASGCDNQDAARAEQARDHVRKLNKASEFYYIEHKKCPESPNDLARLFTGQDENQYDFSKDPWGNDFVMYSAPNSKACHYKSLGADGVEGGDGHGADIQLEEGTSS